MVLAVLLLRVVITSDVPLQAASTAAFDDAWFLRIGESISQGHWLGPYDHLTLIKGQGYPLFIAACHIVGLSLLHAQLGLYIAGCLLCVRALAPWMRSPGWQIALLGALVFNPISFGCMEMARTVREGIYPAQTLLVVACAAGLMFRREWAFRRQLPWAVGLGVFFGWFWITREEAIWLAPTVALLLVPWCWASLRGRRHVAFAGLALAGAGLGLGIVNAVCLANYIKYGKYLTVEYRSRDFLDAYGSLARILPDTPNRLVIVSRDARRKAYALSPTFRQLEPYLDGPSCKLWITVSEASIPGVRGDFAGGWFMWAFRDAVQKSQGFTSCADAMRFYRAMADEINAACDAGQVPARPARSSFAAPYDPAWLGIAAGSFVSGLDRVAHFRGFDPRVALSVNDPRGVEWVREITASPVASVSAQAAYTSGIRFEARRWIGLIYGEAVTTLTVVGLLGAAIRSCRHARSAILPLVLLMAIAGAIVARLVILAWLNTTGFKGLILPYLTPLHPLLLTMMVASLFLTFGSRCTSPPDGGEA